MDTAAQILMMPFAFLAAFGYLVVPVLLLAWVCSRREFYGALLPRAFRGRGFLFFMYLCFKGVAYACAFGMFIQLADHRWYDWQLNIEDDWGAVLLSFLLVCGIIYGAKLFFIIIAGRRWMVKMLLSELPAIIAIFLFAWLICLMFSGIGGGGVGPT